MHVLNDRNWQEYVHRSQDAGFLRGALPRQTNVGGLKCAKPFEEVIKPIPESEWEARIKDITARKAWPADHLRVHNYTVSQNGLGYCWAYSLASAVTTQRLTAGEPFVELAAESLGGLVNFRNQGGYLDLAIAYAAKNGICDRSFAPQYNLRPSTWKTGWQEEALNHRPAEWFDLDGDSWRYSVSALLSGFVLYIGYDWWGHAVEGVRLVIIDGEICLEIFNSHGDIDDHGFLVIQGSRKVPDLGSFALRTSTWSEG